MGDPIPNRGDMGAIVQMMREFDRRLRNLEMPTGTQYAQAVANLAQAVADLVDFDSVGLSTTAFPIGAAFASVAHGELQVPEGYTRAAVLGIVSLGAWNPTTTAGYVYVRCGINGSPGSSVPELASPGSYRAVSGSAIRTLDGLAPGAIIPVDVEVRADAAWGSTSVNIANIDVIALFRK